MKFKLDEAESEAIIRDRSQGVKPADRTGFVGRVTFYNGPRGGRFRPLRTNALLTLDAAVEAADKLACIEWARWRRTGTARVQDVTVHEVNIYGQVVS